MRKILLVLLVLSAFSTAAHAVLQPQVKLVVSITPTNGIDTITIFNGDTNAQISVCNNPAPCTSTFRSGTKLKLVATSNVITSFGFSNWGATTGSAAACANSNNNVCNFTITQDTNTPVVFKPVHSFRVQLGEGDGVLRVKKGGVQLFDCANKAPLSCSTAFLDGTRIRIEAIANPNASPPQQFQKFTAQTGNATVCTGQGAAFSCEFSLTKDTSLVGNFIQIP